MSTFLGSTVPKVQKEERMMMNGEVVNFKYLEVVADHYIYRGGAENNNDVRNDGRAKPQIGLQSA